MTAADGCDAGMPGQFEAPDGEVSQNLMNRLAPLRRQWDLAVLANLAAGTERPEDLIEAINASQRRPPDRLEVLNDTLRRLERRGFVARQEMPGVPRGTRYRLRPPRRRLISALSLLDTWYGDHEPGDGAPGAPSREHPAGNRNDSSNAGRIPARPRPDRTKPPQPVGLEAGPAAAPTRRPRRISRRCRRGSTSPTAR